MSSYFLSGLEKYKAVDAHEVASYRALILLGGGLERQSSIVTPTILGYSRILEAVRIYQIAKNQGINYKVIITGGDVRKYGISEAQLYGQILETLGVNKDDLIFEKESLNTYQNAKYTKEIVDKLPYKEYLLVTSAIHMKRATIYFKNFDIPIIPAISDNPQAIVSFIPNTYNLTLLNLAIHENMSIIRLKLYNFLGINSKENVFSRAGQ